MTEVPTLTSEQEIKVLRSQLSEREKTLRETRQAIDRLAQAPHFRAQNLQELEAQLSKKREQDATCQGQALEYIGSDLQGLFEREAKESTQKLKEYEKLIRDTRQKHAKQDTEDNEEKRSYKNAEQTIMYQVTTLKNKLQELVQQQDTKKREAAEKAYQEYQELYQDMVKSAADKQEAQDEILRGLADWPDLQERFLQEHNVPIVYEMNGTQKIARAAIEYYEALIEHAGELQDAAAYDGTPLSEVLALTDQEVLAHGHDGGIALLQEKRAVLLRYV